MSKVYIFLADGFEEIEGLTVVDILRRGNVDIETVSISGQKEVLGSHRISVKADRTFEDGSLADGDMYVLPGGMPGTKYLGAHEGLCALLKEAKAKGKKIAAICAAPSVLGDLGLLEGEKAACYPGFEERLKGAEVVYERAVVSGQVTTSRGMGTAIPFALCLLGQLAGQEKADEIRSSIIYGCHTQEQK